MKRIALCILSLLLLVGCAAKPAATTPKTQGFSCKAKVTIQKSVFEAELQIPEGGIFTATLTAPATVKGTVLAWNGEEVTATLHGLTLHLPPDKLPGGNAIGGIRSVLQTLQRGGATQNTDGSLRGQSAAGSFTATLRADGFPVEIALPEYDTTVVLSDFSYIFS